MDTATIPLSVMDTLHDVTMDTIFDVPERFDALKRDLRMLAEEHGPDATAAQIHAELCAGNLVEKLSPRARAMLTFFWNLKPDMTAREIVAGLEA
jgi:hypothetical protein